MFSVVILPNNKVSKHCSIWFVMFLGFAMIWYVFKGFLVFD